MSFLLVSMPVFLLATAFVFFWVAKKLGFFSRQARDLKDIRSELKELRIEEFEMLQRPEALLNGQSHLTARQRREAAAKRLELTRHGLRVILWNASLFEEVGRFRLRSSEATPDSSTDDENTFAGRIFDRAAMCHVMAALCLGKLQLIEVMRIAFPFYEPNLAVIRGHSLIAWYRDVVNDIVKLANQDGQKDWIYGGMVSMLTGALELEVKDA